MSDENLLTRQVEEYITYKRGLGFKITIEAQELRRFAAYARTVGHNGSLTSELAVRWASLNKDYSRFYMARRLETVHTFAKYASAFDSGTQIPQTGLFGKCHMRISPYIYSDEEVLMLMIKAGNLFSPDGVRARTVSTAIGLLRSTGIRVSELTFLKNDDVRLSEGYLFIHSSKFKKDRIVPLHPTVTAKLSDYRNFIETKLGKRNASEYFFINSYGQRFNTRSFEYAFQLIRSVLPAYTGRGRTRNYRLYDLRHTFCSETVRRWLTEGEDVNQKLYLLSVYVGHVKPENTYWYLSATPELLAVSCERYETAFGEGASE
jgi:site-specific recombinase XerD